MDLEKYEKWFFVGLCATGATMAIGFGEAAIYQINVLNFFVLLSILYVLRKK